MSKVILKKTSIFYIAVSIHNFTWNICNFICEKVKVQFSRSSKSFGEDLEDPRSDKIYSSGNRGVKKGLGPRGSRDEEFLVPSLAQCTLCTLCASFFESSIHVLLSQTEISKIILNYLTQWKLVPYWAGRKVLNA